MKISPSDVTTVPSRSEVHTNFNVIYWCILQRNQIAVLCAHNSLPVETYLIYVCEITLEKTDP
jgi:hypothetical protein